MKTNVGCGESFVYWAFYEGIYWGMFKHWTSSYCSWKIVLTDWPILESCKNQWPSSFKLALIEVAPFGIQILWQHCLLITLLKDQPASLPIASHDRTSSTLFYLVDNLPDQPSQFLQILLMPLFSFFDISFYIFNHCFPECALLVISSYELRSLSD